MKPIDFNDLYWDGQHYDLQNRDYVNDIPFYLRKARQYSEPILELACGTGRITIPIAEQGIDITGLDISEPMISYAKKKAKEKMLPLDGSRLIAVISNWIESLISFSSRSIR